MVSAQHKQFEGIVVDVRMVSVWFINAGRSLQCQYVNNQKVKTQGILSDRKHSTILIRGIKLSLQNNLHSINAHCC